MKSIHDKLERVRKPRVHIKYEVETDGATQQKELPFVVGVLGDFSADSVEPTRPLRERKFIQIDRDNFDVVMSRLKPGLKLKVNNTIQPDAGDMVVELQFNSMEDFEPEQIVAQVDPLRRLLAIRNNLRDLLTKVDCSEELETILETVLQDSAQLSKLAKELEVIDN